MQTDAGFAIDVLPDGGFYMGGRIRNDVTFDSGGANQQSFDADGIDSFVEDKHWGCRGSMVIDARIKSHHAPPLIEDPAVTRRVDELAAAGGPLHGLF